MGFAVQRIEGNGAAPRARILILRQGVDYEADRAIMRLL
jgi:hypothetical protein